MLQNVEMLLVLLKGNNAPGIMTGIEVRAGEKLWQAEATSWAPGLECSLESPVEPCPALGLRLRLYHNSLFT